jgi:peptidoglycan/LPS O-acetylase OafA/YrhL
LAEPIPSQPKKDFSFQERMPALDGLRGLAILAVFFYHYAKGTGIHSDSLVLKVMSGVTQFGWAGVDLFFVLSGFLITGILYDTRDDPNYFKTFYIRRTLRIFPLYYFFLLIVAVVGLFVGMQWHLVQATFLLYVGYPVALVYPDALTSSTSIRVTHLWSLCLEEQFYLLWPLMVWTVSKPKWILRLCGILFFLALLLRVLIWQTGWLEEVWAYTFLLFRMDSLAFGAFLAILVRGPNKQRAVRLAPYILTCAGLLLGIVIYLSPSTNHQSSPLMWTAGFSLNAIISGCLLLLALDRGGIIYRVFDTTFWRELGKYSYGMYVYHFPLGVLLDPLKTSLIASLHSEALAKITFVLGSLAINYVVARASFQLFESRFLKLKSKFSYAKLLPAPIPGKRMLPPRSSSS